MKQYREMSVNKYKEMNDSRLVKGLRVLRREGFLRFLYRFVLYGKRLFILAITPIVLATAPQSFFYYNGKRLKYVLHKQSLAWTNERAVEVPIIMDYIRNSSAKKILEVGAVLLHYYPLLKKDVIDKFEKGSGIINEDAIDFRPPNEKYDLIVSISTLEHVGFDDDVNDPNGILKAIDNLKSNCLKKGGEIVVTLPIGYNINADKFIFNDKLGFCEEHYLKRKNIFNRWEEITKDKAKGSKFGAENAKVIVVGVIKK